MANKNLGLGTIGQVNGNRIELLTNMTPPVRSRALIDGTALDDELATNELGIEEHSEFTFNQMWDPGDTDHEVIDTCFDTKALKQWDVIYTNGYADSFDGKVSRVAPQTIETNGLLMREVTIQRLSAISRSVAEVGTQDE